MDVNNLFQQQGKIWKVKEFHGRYLSALLQDLNNQMQSGIPDEVCNELFSCLNNSVMIAEKIKDGTFVFVPYSKQVEDFSEKYRQWNDVEKGTTGILRRYHLHKKLRKIREGLNSAIYREMRKVKGKSDEERAKRYKELRDMDDAQIEKLSTVFTNFANKYPNQFPELLVEVKKPK